MMYSSFCTFFYTHCGAAKYLCVGCTHITLPHPPYCCLAAVVRNIDASRAESSTFSWIFARWTLVSLLFSFLLLPPFFFRAVLSFFNKKDKRSPEIRQKQTRLPERLLSQPSCMDSLNFLHCEDIYGESTMR